MHTPSGSESAVRASADGMELETIANGSRGRGAASSGHGADGEGDDDPTDITDGRTLRRRRNRDSVITALIDLINEGDLDPTIDKVADRAEVSARSVFRYFTDLNDLARTAIETEIRNTLPLAVIPNVGEGPFEDRVDGMVASRMRVIMRTWRLGRVAKVRAADIPEIDRGLAVVAEMVRDQFRRHFSAEFSQLDESVAEGLATSLSSAMDHDNYDTLRRLLNRSDDEIAAGWRELLLRSLG
ncbi:MAG: hypothetical protein AAFP84_07490 [Actinomycetota bacterium]